MHGTVIVAIDDDQLLHPVVKHTFKGSDYTVHCASDGEEGWSLIQLHCPDFVLLDLDLPDVDGEEILNRIQGDRSFDKTKVILLSGNDLDADAIAEQHPEVAVIHKPFSPAKLFDAISLATV